MTNEQKPLQQRRAEALARIIQLDKRHRRKSLSDFGKAVSIMLMLAAIAYAVVVL